MNVIESGVSKEQYEDITGEAWASCLVSLKISWLIKIASSVSYLVGMASTLVSFVISVVYIALNGLGSMQSVESTGVTVVIFLATIVVRVINRAVGYTAKVIKEIYGRLSVLEALFYLQEEVISGISEGKEVELGEGVILIDGEQIKIVGPDTLKLGVIDCRGEKCLNFCSLDEEFKGLKRLLKRHPVSYLISKVFKKTKMYKVGVDRVLEIERRRIKES